MIQIPSEEVFGPHKYTQKKNIPNDSQEVLPTCPSSCISTNLESSWWLQLIWKIFVKFDEHQKYLKPPPSWMHSPSTTTSKMIIDTSLNTYTYRYPIVDYTPRNLIYDIHILTKIPWFVEKNNFPLSKSWMILSVPSSKFPETNQRHHYIANPNSAIFSKKFLKNSHRCSLFPKKIGNLMIPVECLVLLCFVGVGSPVRGVGLNLDMSSSGESRSKIFRATCRKPQVRRGCPEWKLGKNR